MIESNLEKINREEIIEKINKKLQLKFVKEIDITELEWATDIFGYIDNFELMERELVEGNRWYFEFRYVYKLEEDFYISIIVTEGTTVDWDADDCVDARDVISSIRRVYPKTINVIAYTE
jgi:hypothetical protein